MFGFSAFAQSPFAGSNPNKYDLVVNEGVRLASTVNFAYGRAVDIAEGIALTDSQDSVFATPVSISETLNVIDSVSGKVEFNGFIYEGIIAQDGYAEQFLWVSIDTSQTNSWIDIETVKWH